MRWEYTEISKEISGHNGSKTCVELLSVEKFRSNLSMGEHKLRITIHADFYDFQSHASIEVWDKPVWREVYGLRGVAVKSRPNGNFEDDRKRLLRIAEELLS